MARNGFNVFEWNFKVIVVLILISILNWVLFSSFNIRVYYALIPALLALQLFLNEVLEHFLLSNVKSTRWFSFLVSPGTIIHELSHTVAALISGCKIVSLSLFSFNKKTGVLGSVTYIPRQDRLSFLREILITFSPFFGCSIAMILISKYVFHYTLSLELLQIGFSDLLHQLSTPLRMLVDEYSQAVSGSPILLIALYLQLCFAFGAAPSAYDFKGLIYSLKKNFFGLLLLISILLASVLLVEYPLPLGDYSSILSNLILNLLIWAVFLLSLSTSLLLFSLILVYSISFWLSVDFIPKLFSIAIFAISYYLSLYFLSSEFYSLALSWLVFISALLLIKNQNFFVKQNSR